MAKRFEKKDTDKKEERKVGIGKAIAAVGGTLLSAALFIITKGKSGGTKT